jgi:catechol 2,3-dioxygenase-like lactoylglutathione lyase family enzyme
MLGRYFISVCVMALGARQVAAQVTVVGPSFAALSVPDLAASVQWYREVFGLNIVFEAVAPDSATKVVLLAGAGLRIELVWHRSARSLSSYAGGPTQPDMVFGAPKIGFYVRDIDSALAVLRSQRATIEGTWLVRPSHIPDSDTLWARNILVRDTSGTYVQLFERRP